jgi:hypothetical protein
MKHTITVKEAAWLAKAAYNARKRNASKTPLPETAGVFLFEGRALVVSTDSHRLHAVRLGPCGLPDTAGVPLPKSSGRLLCVLDAAFAANTAKSLKADVVSLNLEDPSVSFLHASGTELLRHPLEVPSDERWYDSVLGVALRESSTGGAGPVQNACFWVNAQYFADAAMCASDGKVHVRVRDGLKPLLIEPYDGDRWFSLVMPMNGPRREGTK